MFNQDVLDKLNEIQRDISTIKKDISTIKKDVSEIKEQLNKVENGTSKMTSHIDFVDTVYEKVRSPLDIICNKFSMIAGGNTETITKKLEYDPEKNR